MPSAGRRDCVGLTSSKSASVVSAAGYLTQICQVTNIRLNSLQYPTMKLLTITHIVGFQVIVAK